MHYTRLLAQFGSFKELNIVYFVKCPLDIRYLFFFSVGVQGQFKYMDYNTLI